MKRVGYILTGIILLSVILAWMRRPVLTGLGQFLVVQEADLQPADVIHVLGGGYDRLDYALVLYRQGYAPRLFVTGDDDAVIYKKYLVAKGAAPADLVPDTSWATTTYEEALELKQFLAGEPAVRSVIVVSSPYHMRRVKWTFEQVLQDQVALQFAPVPLEPDPEQREWWRDAGMRNSVVKEYVKLGYYYVTKHQ